MTQITSLIFLPGIEVTHQLITRAKKPRFVYNRRTKRQVDNNVVTLEADEPIDINTNFTPPVSTSLYSEKCIILEGQGQAGQGRAGQGRIGQGRGNRNINRNRDTNPFREFILIFMLQIVFCQYLQIHKWKKGWNIDNATHECENAILKSDVGKLCKDLPGVNAKQDVRTCVEDIQVGYLFE